MKRSMATTTCLAMLAVLGWGAVARSEPLAEGEREPAAPYPKCVQVSAQAMYRAYGYDHIVVIANGCEAAMRCSVVTNVNPQAAVVVVSPGKSEDVVTFRGSPAREFQADVSCKESK